MPVLAARGLVKLREAWPAEHCARKVERGKLYASGTPLETCSMRRGQIMPKENQGATTDSSGPGRTAESLQSARGVATLRLKWLQALLRAAEIQRVTDVARSAQARSMRSEAKAIPRSNPGPLPGSA